jgi:hypothetical protein
MRKTLIGILSVFVTAVMLFGMGNVVADTTPHKLTVPYSTSTPELDGNITDGEYDDSAYINFDVDGICGLGDDDVTIYAQHNGYFMFIGIDVVFDDTYNDSMFDDYLTIIFDMDSDGEIDYMEDSGSNPFDDDGFWMPSDQYTEITGDIVIGGRGGFEETNLSSDEHTIFEIAVADFSLPAPGTYFGIWMVGEQQDCDIAMDEDYSGWAYPDDVIADPNVYTDYDNWTVDDFAQWTLEAQPVSTKPTYTYNPYLAWLLVMIIAATLLVLAMKSKDKTFMKKYLNIAIVIIFVCIAILAIGYYQGWLTFS